MERYIEERAALEMKYSDICKPLYEERGNVVSRILDDEIERIHKGGGGKKEYDGVKGRRQRHQQRCWGGIGERWGRIPGGCLQ